MVNLGFDEKCGLEQYLNTNFFEWSLFHLKKIQMY